MKTRAFFLTIVLSALAATPMWAHQQKADENLMAQLEQRLAESNAKSKGLTGKPRSLWLLRQAEIEKIIGRLKAGESVDPKEIDVILKGQVN